MTGKTFRKLMRADQELLEAVTKDIKAAARTNNREYVRYGFELFLDVARSAQETMGIYFKPIPHQLGAGSHEEAGRSWYDSSPEEIIEDLYTARSTYLAFIHGFEEDAKLSDELEARQLDRTRVNYMRRLALIVMTAKDLLQKKSPGSWTEKMERDFKEWIDFKFI